MNSLIEQKARVTRLRDLYEKETNPIIKEFMKSSLACARLLHDIVEYDVLEPERIEQVKPKTNKRAWQYVLDAFIAIGIAVILAVALFGCHTVSGFGRDLSTWSSPYIQENEK